MSDETKGQAPTTTNTEDQPFRYTAGTAQVKATTWVVQFIFGQPASAGVSNKEVVDMVVGLPWPLAKILHHVLGQLIAQYETFEGTITVPRSVEASIAAQTKRMVEDQARREGSGG